MTRIRRVTMAVLALAAGCAHYVTVECPPIVDLRGHGMVGLVKFEVLEGEPALADEATHRFLATVQRLQPGARVLELGTKEAVLAKIGARELDPAALQAIGKAFGVGAVLTGNLAVRKPRPQVSVESFQLTSVSAAMKVDASMQATLREAAGGATVWTNGASGTWTLGGVGVSGGRVSGGLSDPAQKYEQILTELVRITADDFRPTWERRRVEEK